MRLKRLGVLVVCSLLAGGLFYQSIFSTVFAQNSARYSTIGGVEITSEKESDIQALLANEIQRWKEQPLIVAGQSAVIEIPTSFVQFDIPKSIENYFNSVHKPWYKFGTKQTVQEIPLEVTLSEEVRPLLKGASFFYVDETYEAVCHHASLLKESAVEAKEIPLSKDLMTRLSFEIQEFDVSSTNLSSFAHVLNDMQLRPGETFSFLNKYGELINMKDKETINFFASVLYSVILQADIAIIERHSQQSLPDYLSPGIEADVNQALERDFIFRNESKSPIIFTAHTENNRLQIELYGLQNDIEMSYSVTEEKVKPRTIYRLSNAVKNNEQKVIREGNSGLRTTVYKKTYDPKEGFEVEEQISRDFYPPTHKVVLVSSVQEKPSNDTGSTEEQDHQDEQDKTNQNNEKKSQQNQSNEENQPTEKEPPEEVQYDKGGNVITEQDE